jgi:hypothetical protein
VACTLLAEALYSNITSSEASGNRFRYIIPMGPISSSSAVFFCSSLSVA